jgi:transposase
MLPRGVQIWFAIEPVDMRCGHDGLMAVAKNRLGLDPFSGHLVVFLSKGRDRCKVVFFDRGGFVLYYKRLEQGRFAMPRHAADGSHSVTIDATDLAMLLDGIDFSRVRRPPLWQPKKVHPVDPGSTSRSRSDLTRSWSPNARTRMR